MDFLYSFEHYFSSILIFLIQILYPIYRSIKALDTDHGSDDTEWLIYWVVWAFLSFIEEYFLSFLSFVPFFMILRVLFYIWLQIPIFNGSFVIFNKFIHPFFSQNFDENHNNIAIQSFFKTLKLVYNDLLSMLPQPQIDDDSSPSGEPGFQ